MNEFWPGVIVGAFAGGVQGGIGGALGAPIWLLFLASSVLAAAIVVGETKVPPQK